MVEYRDTQYRLHANMLRHYNVRVECIRCFALHDHDLVANSMPASVDQMQAGEGVRCNSAIVYESDTDFGELVVVEPDIFKRNRIEPFPSSKLSSAKVSHLSLQQRRELLDVLDRYPEVFFEIPGLCTVAEHVIPITGDFKPKRLNAYRVPQHFKAEVSRQIKELEQLGFIERSTSPMASPIVCVLKPKDHEGHQGVRIAIDYKYVNRFTVPSVAPLEDVSDLLQEVGQYKILSLFDVKSGYHHCKVAERDRWLTSFICDDGQFEWTRNPFGMRSSGTTFVRAIKLVWQPIREFSKSFVDDMVVHSNDWQSHLVSIDSFLSVILKKCELAKPEVKLVGHIVGGGRRRPNSEKVLSVQNLKEPETKRQVRQVIGIFSFFVNICQILPM